MIRSTSSVLRGALVVLLLVAVLIPATGGGAGAALGPERFICTASGAITTTAQPESWTIIGGGSCVSQYNPYFLTFTGAGTSKGLGLCGPEGNLPFIVRDLDLIVTGTLTATNPFDPYVVGLLQHWTAPITTYPLGTPFLVTTNDGAPFGGGVFWNHIFLNCQGSPVATFQWIYQP